MLLGRTAELKYLNNYYEREGSQIIVVYGAKRIGKTALIQTFGEGKPVHFYRARSCCEREQLYQWSAELRQEDIGVLKYPSFENIFTAITDGQQAKTILVIEEFQNLVKWSPDFMQELIGFIHNQWNQTQIMVILCSSAVGWVENSMVKKIGEAAYELSGLLKLKELRFEDLEAYFSRFSKQQCMEVYSLFGGFPGLWKYFDDNLSVPENIICNILKKSGGLHNTALEYVEEELRETAVYNTILAAVAEGKQKLNELYLHTQFSRAKISVYLKNLMELEIIEKVFSVDTDGKANTQKGIYRIRNHFVHFYYQFLYANMSGLETKAPEIFYQEVIAPGLRSYVSGYFKDICAQHLEQLNEHGKLPFVYEKSGEWVGKNGNIDIVAMDEKGRTLVALCNYEKPMMTYEDYEVFLNCMKKAKLSADYIYLYSIDRFDEKLSLEAKVKKNMTLVSFRE